MLSHSIGCDTLGWDNISSDVQILCTALSPVGEMQLPRLGKPRRGLQIFDTRVDFPVPVQKWL